MIAGIGHNCPPIERFDLAHRPNVAQMNVDAIVVLIDQLEAELVPLRDEALARHRQYNVRFHDQLCASRSSGFAPPLPGEFDYGRFRELQSILADCRIEIRDRQPKHAQAWPSEHEKAYAQRCRFGT